MARLTLTAFALYHAAMVLLLIAIAALLPDTRLGHLMSESALEKNAALNLKR